MIEAVLSQVGHAAARLYISHLLPFSAEIDGRAEPGRLYLRGRYVLTAGEPLRCEGSSPDRPLIRSVAEQDSCSASGDSSARVHATWKGCQRPRCP